MDAIILTREHYDFILKELNEIKDKLDNRSTETEDGFIDSQQFLRKMGVSKRTAQKWRDEGVIAFSQIGNKIYYKTTDVEELLKDYHRSPFRKPFRTRK